MATDVEDAHLTELLFTQLLNSRELKEQITQFRKRDPDDPKRCYGTLIDTIDEHLPVSYTHLTLPTIYSV